MAVAEGTGLVCQACSCSAILLSAWTSSPHRTDTLPSVHRQTQRLPTAVHLRTPWYLRGC